VVARSRRSESGPRVMTPETRPARSARATGPAPRRRRDDFWEAVLRARVLLSSYAPLLFILFARVHSTPLRVIFLGLGLLGLGDALRLTLLAGDKQAVPRSFVEVRDSGSQVAGYLATYLLPLLAAPDPDAGDLVGYSIYAFLIVVITLRSDLAHINPTLYLLGWKVVTVVTVDARERYLICKQAPKAGEQVRVTELYGVLHAVSGGDRARTEGMGRLRAG
jgi:hypothetical protein